MLTNTIIAVVARITPYLAPAVGLQPFIRRCYGSAARSRKARLTLAVAATVIALVPAIAAPSATVELLLGGLRLVCPEVSAASAVITAD